MNGVHDMGGEQGMGSVRYEKDEPVFHARWEGRIAALNWSMRARRKWSLDTDRHWLETMPPVDYLRMSYYERWVVRLEAQLLKFGLVTPEEMKSGKAAPGSTKATPALTLETSSRWLNRGIASNQDPSVPPHFQVGQRIRARNINPTGHTRLPRYARGKTGIVARDNGVYDFPDTKAHFQGNKRQHLYSVRFSARELWGESVSRHDSVYIDLWDDYLERA